MSIVGEVIEKLMGDSYHSVYLRDPRYLQTVAEKSCKTSLDVLFVGKSLKADSFTFEENAKYVGVKKKTDDAISSGGHPCTLRAEARRSS